jgi:hypothetical protein
MALTMRLLVSIWLSLILGLVSASPASLFGRPLLRGAAGVARRADIELAELPVGDASSEVPSASMAQQPRQRPILECFQVHQPVLGENGLLEQTMLQSDDSATSEHILSGAAAQASCKQVLMVHSFGWSYGKPFIGENARRARLTDHLTDGIFRKLHAPRLRV